MNTISFNYHFFSNFQLSSPEFFVDKSNGNLYPRDLVSKLFLRKVDDFIVLYKNSADTEKLRRKYIKLLHCSYIIRKTDPMLEDAWSLSTSSFHKKIAQGDVVNHFVTVNPTFNYDLCGLRSEEIQRLLFFYRSDPEKQLDILEFIKRLPQIRVEKRKAVACIHIFSKVEVAYNRGCILHLMDQFEQSKLSWQDVANILEFFFYGNSTSIVPASNSLRALQPLNSEDLSAALECILTIFHKMFQGTKAVVFDGIDCMAILQNLPEKERFEVIDQSLSLFAEGDEVSYRIEVVECLSKIPRETRKLHGEVFFNLYRKQKLTKEELQTTSKVLGPLMCDVVSPLRREAILKAVFMLPKESRNELHLRSMIALFDFPFEDRHEVLLLDQIEAIPLEERSPRLLLMSKHFQHLTSAKDKALLLKGVSDIPLALLHAIAEDSLCVVERGMSVLEHLIIIKAVAKIPFEGRKILIQDDAKRLMTGIGRASDRINILNAILDIPEGDRRVLVKHTLSLCSYASEGVKREDILIQLRQIFKKHIEFVVDCVQLYVGNARRKDRDYIETKINSWIENIKNDLSQSKRSKTSSEELRLDSQYANKLKVAIYRLIDLIRPRPEASKKTSGSTSSKGPLQPVVKSIKMISEEPKQSREEFIEARINAVWRNGLDLNVTVDLRGAPCVIKVLGISGEKFQLLRGLLKKHYPHSHNLIQNSGGTHDIVLTSKDAGSLYALFSNDKFIRELESGKKKNTKELVSILAETSSGQLSSEINKEEWIKQLKRLTFGGVVEYDGDALVVDFTESYNGLDKYSLSVKPLKASSREYFLPCLVDDYTLENQVISRLTTLLPLKKNTGPSAPHKFAFKVCEKEPDLKSCHKIHEDIAAHFIKAPSSVRQKTDDVCATSSGIVTEIVDRKAQQDVPVRELLIDLIRGLTEEREKDFRWLVKSPHKKKHIVTWDVKQVRVINLQGKTVDTQEFFKWLCGEVSGLQFVANLPDHRAGIRINEGFRRFLTEENKIEQGRQAFLCWVEGSKKLPEEPDPCEDVKHLFDAVPVAIQRSHHLPPFLDWTTLLRKLNPVDPIRLHVEKLGLFFQAPLDQSNMVQFRTWQLHFFRFIHLLRDRYREGCPKDQEFLTPLRTVLRHNTFRLDWEKHEGLLKEIIQYGLHFLDHGFDSYLIDFKSRMNLFNNKHMDHLDTQAEFDLEDRMAAEMHVMRDLLAGEDPCATAIIMTAAIIGKLVKLRKQDRIDPFGELCMDVRAELGHLEPSRDYIQWEQAGACNIRSIFYSLYKINNHCL